MKQIKICKRKIKYDFKNHETDEHIKHLDRLCRCANVSTYEVSPASEEENEEEEEEELRTRQLSSPGDDVIVECVAYNAIGESRGVFKPGKCHNINMLSQ